MYGVEGEKSTKYRSLGNSDTAHEHESPGGRGDGTNAGE